MVINLFCDASIDLNTHIGCGGTYVTLQDASTSCKELGTKLVLQNNATNNSVEILAIWTGIREALILRNSAPPHTVFRLFSDSKVSLYGVRDWIKNWVQNVRPDGTLISSSGNPVANQDLFADIYNIIVESGLHIEFYHQRGHVNERVKLDKARTSFTRANKISPEGLGLDISYLSKCNDMIDNLTRTAIYDYIAGKPLPPYVELPGVHPIQFHVRDNMLPTYMRNIDKTSISSRHNFRNGYSQ